VVRISRRQFLGYGLSALAASGLAACAPAGAPAPAPQQAAQTGQVTPAPPTRPVEFVISTTPGGGSDIYARFIIGIIEKHKLSPQPFVPVNKAG